ncbi:ABC transporter substrate-binding protein [Bacillus sp. B15-48]|nr:ABC transporter substrate-binding protein [Bacillus sp. B15-48]MBM4763695.1 ABC transporter substrate-binding protein [Bacillus sp. B15-48]
MIFAEKEENTKEIVESLEKNFPVYVAEVQSISDAYEMILEMGDLTNRKEQADNLVAQIKGQFAKIPSSKTSSLCNLEETIYGGRKRYIYSVRFRKNGLH